MDPEECVEATVPTRHLYSDEPGSDLAHARTPVLLDGATRYVQGGDLGYELERKLGLLPVFVDYRDDLGVSESPNPVPDRTLLVSEQLVEQVVVSPQRPGDVGDHATPPSLGLRESQLYKDPNPHADLLSVLLSILTSSR
jgi:hypothetical protein